MCSTKFEIEESYSTTLDMRALRSATLRRTWDICVFPLDVLAGVPLPKRVEAVRHSPPLRPFLVVLCIHGVALALVPVER